MTDGEGKVEGSDRKGTADGLRSPRRPRGLTSRSLCHESWHPEELFYSLHRLTIHNGAAVCLLILTNITFPKQCMEVTKGSF